MSKKSDIAILKKAEKKVYDRRIYLRGKDVRIGISAFRLVGLKEAETLISELRKRLEQKL